MQIRKIISYRRLFLVILWNLFLVFLDLLLDFIHHGVVDGLICFLIGKSEPSSVKFTFLSAFSTSVEFFDSQQYHSTWLLDSTQRYLDLLVIVNLEYGISTII